MRDIASRYRVEIMGGDFAWTPACYFTRDRKAAGIKADGPATDAGLARYMNALIESTKPGGANEHLARFGVGLPVAARLVDQDSGETVARWPGRKWKVVLRPASLGSQIYPEEVLGEYDSKKEAEAHARRSRRNYLVPNEVYVR